MNARLDLRLNPLFHGVNGCDMALLLGQAREKSAVRKSCFFHEQDVAVHGYLLLSGRIKLVQTNAEGAQVANRILGPGEMFGWAGIMGGDVYPASALAMTDSSALCWETGTVRKAMLSSPRLAVNALDLIGARLREAQDRLRELATERVELRIARALLRLTEKISDRNSTSITIDFPLSRQDLAEISGTTLYTVSRVLTGWEQSEIIRTGRQSLVLLNPAALAEMLVLED